MRSVDVNSKMRKAVICCLMKDTGEMYIKNFIRHTDGWF
eukprot:UN02925